MFLLNHNPKPLPVLDEACTADMLQKPDTRAGCGCSATIKTYSRT